MTNFVIGIDPGLSGAAVLYDTESQLVCDYLDMPTKDIITAGKKKRKIDAYELFGWLEQQRKLTSKVFVEKVGAMPGQGVTSSFNFGFSAGAIEACCLAVGLKITYIQPQTWKRAMGLLGKDKNASRELAGKLLPMHLPFFARAKDDGRAEAALIAIYGSSLK